MKPFLELATELPKAFAKAEADQKAYQTAAAKKAQDVATAKAAYDAAVAKSDAAAAAAAEKAGESAAYLRTIQDEINTQLGNQFNPRVRQG